MRIVMGIGAIFATILAPLMLFGSSAVQNNGPQWEIEGEMSEACTCAVPCGCNFRSGPSHHYCWSIASFDIQKGHHGNVNLDGLHMVRGHGQKAIVWYIDDSATSSQAAALQAIGTHISESIHSPLGMPHFERAHIVQVNGKAGSEVSVGDAGGFKTNYLIGRDGKNPIVVENMTSWNVRHDIKGRTERLHYKDRYGDEFNMPDTNSNEGQFDWTDRTATYF
jgi:hypothetical protein